MKKKYQKVHLKATNEYIDDELFLKLTEEQIRLLQDLYNRSWLTPCIEINYICDIEFETV